MAKRSPILGFNHNFRHRGLVFHVQTEDSGIQNPHIFTHLFNGGVIISSRKLTYDVGSAEEVVKALMQAQHKAMLKDLKKGTFDAKIDEYFGDNPDLVPLDTAAAPRDVEDTAPSARVPTMVDEVEITGATTLSAEEMELDDAEIEIIGGPADTLRNAPAIVIPTDSAPIEIEAEPSEPIEADDLPVDDVPADGVPVAPTPGAYAQHRTGSYERLPESGPRRKSRTGTAELVRTPRTESRPPALPPQAIEIAAEVEAAAPVPEPEVVVSRPSVIVGAPPTVVGNNKKKTPPPTPPAAGTSPPRRAREGSASLFGKDLISEKSLDEVILAYLSEDGGRDGGS